MRINALKKPIATIVACAMMVSMLPALALASKADAATVNEKPNVGLLANTNTTMGTARVVPLNSSASVAFDGGDKTTCNYWFKFKTSSKNSVYKVKVASLDSGSAYRHLLDSNGKTLTSRTFIMGKPIMSYSPIATDWIKLRTNSDKNAWMYVQLECTSY